MASAAFSLLGSLIPGIGGILGGINSRNAAKVAATKIANAANQGVADIQGSVDRGGQIMDARTQDANLRLFELLGNEKENLDPYLSTGKTGTQMLQDLLTNPQGALEKTPGYQFTLDQGKKAIGNTAAARGSASSGNVLEELTKYGQGLAGTTYQNAIQNALGASNMGLNATGDYNAGLEKLGGQQANNMVNLGVNEAQLDANAQPKIADLLLQGAGASAAGTLGAAQAGNQLIGVGGSGIQDLIDAIGKLKKNSSSNLGYQPLPTGVGPY